MPMDISCNGAEEAIMFKLWRDQFMAEFFSQLFHAAQSLYRLPGEEPISLCIGEMR
jgi:hypothetical protein